MGCTPGAARPTFPDPHPCCSRKKGPEFVTEFFKVLPRALRHMMLKADERTAASLNKVIRVWEERRVFGRWVGGRVFD